MGDRRMPRSEQLLTAVGFWRFGPLQARNHG